MLDEDLLLRILLESIGYQNSPDGVDCNDLVTGAARHQGVILEQLFFVERPIVNFIDVVNFLVVSLNLTLHTDNEQQKVVL